MSSKRLTIESKFPLSSDEEEPELLESNKELEKLNSIWKNLKDAKKNINSGSVSTILGKNYTKPNDKSINLEESLGNKTMIDSAKEKDQAEKKDESLLIQTREKNSALLKKLAEATEEIERCHEKIAKERNDNLHKESKIQEITSKIENISYHQKEFLDKSKTNQEVFEQELEKKNKQIEKLIENNYRLEENVKYLEIKATELEEENKFLQQNLSVINNENSRIKSKLCETEKTIDELFLQKESESAALLELEYLKGDVGRLLNLLKSTQEYKDFSLNKEGSEVRFLKEISKKINHERSSSHFRKNNRSCCGEKEHSNERFFWVPKESFDYLHKLKESLKGQILDNETIESLLFELNKLWITKESKLKSYYEKELSKVKRYYSSMISSSEMQAKKTVSRLQHQLKIIKEKENKENNEFKNYLFPFDETRKHQISIETEEKEKDSEIRRLQQKIEILENKKEELYDKTAYMEGSYWMIKKVIKETNLIQTFLNQLETVFRKKLDEILGALSIRENEDEKNEIFNFYEWIIENLYEVVDSYKEKLNSMKNSTKNRLSTNSSNAIIGENFNSFGEDQKTPISFNYSGKN